MRLVEQWSDILSTLPRGWESAALSLTLADPAEAERAALVLGPAAPGRSGERFRLDVARESQPVGTDAGLLRRVLERLDRGGVAGWLELVGTATSDEGADEKEREAGPLARQWRALVDALPPDWSHVLAQVELDSSDFVDRAALDLAPANPVLVRGGLAMRFRSARTVGYGVAAEMAGRCLARLDRDRITGRVSLLRVVSDSRPVATQGGPVWRPGARVP